MHVSLCSILRLDFVISALSDTGVSPTLASSRQDQEKQETLGEHQSGELGRDGPWPPSGGVQRL